MLGVCGLGEVLCRTVKSRPASQRCGALVSGPWEGPSLAAICCSLQRGASTLPHAQTLARPLTMCMGGRARAAAALRLESDARPSIVLEGAEPLPGPLTLSRSPRGSTVAVLRPRPLLTAIPVLWSPSEAFSCLALSPRTVPTVGVCLLP